MAEEWATIAVTPGTGRLEINTNYFLFSKGSSYDALIPKQIRQGTQIEVRYKKEEDWVSTTFLVAGISTKGELCRLHSELPSRYSSSISDTIYVKPCRYK